MSKTAFIDSRVSQSDVEGMKSDAVERGGSVEVFPMSRARKYIQAIASGFPAAVDRMLNPAQASEYQKALKGIR